MPLLIGPGAISTVVIYASEATKFGLGGIGGGLWFGEAQLAKGDSELGRPAVAVDAGRNVPNGVPGEFAINAGESAAPAKIIAADRRVAFHAAGVDREPHGVSPVAKGVETDLKPVGR